MGRTDFIKKLVNAFQLDANLEAIPEKVAAVFLPTFQVNIPVPIIREITDTAANDSDKTFTVPSGKQWKFLFGFADLATTATVGNRRIRMIIEDDAGSILYLIDALTVQPESVTERYNFCQFGDTSESVAAVHTIPTPVNLILPENFSIRILDGQAIAAAADDMNVRFIIEEHDMVEGSTVKEAL